MIASGTPSGTSRAPAYEPVVTMSPARRNDRLATAGSSRATRADSADGRRDARRRASSARRTACGLRCAMRSSAPIEPALDLRADVEPLVVGEIGEQLGKRDRRGIVVAIAHQFQHDVRRADRRADVGFGVGRSARRQVARQDERDLGLDRRRCRRARRSRRATCGGSSRRTAARRSCARRRAARTSSRRSDRRSSRRRARCSASAAAMSAGRASAARRGPAGRRGGGRRDRARRCSRAVVIGIESACRCETRVGAMRCERDDTCAGKTRQIAPWRQSPTTPRPEGSLHA